MTLSFRSPVHRVVLPSAGHRDSFVFFFYPQFAANFGDAARSARAREDNAGASVAAGAAATTPRAAQGAESGTIAADAASAVNTALDLAAADPSTLDLPFGEYIQRKWAAVFRAAASH